MLQVYLYELNLNTNSLTQNIICTKTSFRKTPREGFYMILLEGLLNLEHSYIYVYDIQNTSIRIFSTFAMKYQLVILGKSCVQKKFDAHLPDIYSPIKHR